MIQRIQSLFLLAVILCLGGMNLAPIADFGATTSWSVTGLSGLEAGQIVSGVLPFAIQGIVIGLMALTVFILFSYKNRKRQMALGRLNFLLILALVVVLYLSIDKIAKGLSFDLAQVTYGYATYLPIIALGFHLLANRAIKRDEELVSSVERLR